MDAEVDYDTDGATVLFKAVEQKQWRATVSRVQHCPQEASMWVVRKDAARKKYKSKTLPLHMVCQCEPPLSVVQALLQAYPEAASLKSLAGMLPIHYACKWGASVQVVQILLLAYPDGINQKDASGLKPVDITKKKRKKMKKKSDKAAIDEVILALSEGKEYYSKKWSSVSTEEKVIKRAASSKDGPSEMWHKDGLTIIVIGASGDLAKKKTYPSLLNLFADGLLPDDTTVWGYARSNLSHKELRSKLRPFLVGGRHEENMVDDFLSNCFYRYGNSYGDVDALSKMVKEIEKVEDRTIDSKVGYNRLFYFAIPPTVFAETGTAIKKVAMSGKGWTRIIVEKPFGRDLKTYEELSQILSAQFNEETLYRIDHYLGKEMVQNLLTLRFGNLWLERMWNRDSVQCILLTFKEPFGTEGRGGYFDQFGIIRDILQNHLLQVLTLLTMEPPLKLNGPEASDRVRDAKVHILHSMPPIKLEDCVLGQYEGYTEDPTIENKDSNTPTFAAIYLRINTPRWHGVPIVMKAGKALDERKAEMRVQFKDAPAADFLFDVPCPRNELVMRLQPKESIYLKTNLKSPGFSSRPVQSELELNYDTRYYNRSTEVNPDAYTRLILDALRGQQAAFVRDDELKRSWEIFTPVLHKIEGGSVKPIIYERGTRGPKEADEFIAEKCGFEFYGEYSKNFAPKP